MANVKRLVELSMVPPLAKEVATQIDGAIATKAQVAAIVALTDSTGGTADNTVATIANATAATTDTTAASLTSVNTAIGVIKNDFADLTAKVNTIIAALKA